MNKTELLSMLISDLKALAKKLKIAIPERTKKADIVGAILTAVKADKKSDAKKASPKKAASKTASRKAVPEKAAAVIPARTPKTAAVAPKAEAPRKQPVPKRAPAGKVPEPVAAVHNWKIPPGTEEPLLAQERVSNSKY
ncbi:MAG: hypothetical protein ACM32I_03520, partial [Nitrospirota bacterium]